MKFLRPRIGGNLECKENYIVVAMWDIDMMGMMRSTKGLLLAHILNYTNSMC